MRYATFVHIITIVIFRCNARVSEKIESLSVHPLITPQTLGTTFVFAFLSSHFSDATSENLYVLVSNQDPIQTAQITITSSYPGFQTISISVGPLNVTRIPVFPVDLQSQYPNNVSTATTIENKGLQLVSSIPVTVYTDNERGHGLSSDSMLVLPTCQLGTHYETINDETTIYSTLSMFSVVALQDNTIVHYFNATGAWTNVTLNALQVLTYSHYYYYLTATEIEASQPVAVVTGVVCGIGINNYPICNFETVMLVPEQSWGTQFAFVTFASTANNEFILSANQETNVYLDADLIFTMQEYHYLVFNTSTIYIWTDKPVEVVQVGRRTDNPSSIGAPFFVHTVPTEQFISGSVQFSTNANLATRTQHYVRVTTLLPYIGTIVIDGYTPSALLYTRVGRSKLYFYNIEIAPGTHTVTTTSSTSMYSAVVYGYGDQTGYGFVAGLNLPATNGACSTTQYDHLI